MNLFKSEWLHEPDRPLPAGGYELQRYAPRYGVQCEPRAATADTTRLLQLRNERATLWTLARHDRAA